MKKIILTGSLLCFLLIGCQKDKTIDQGCIKEMLEKYDMNPYEYEGQQYDASFFLEFSEFDGKQYFTVQSIYADMLSFPCDCEGNCFCENEWNEDCERFSQEAVWLGIIGVSK